MISQQTFFSMGTKLEGNHGYQHLEGNHVSELFRFSHLFGRFAALLFFFRCGWGVVFFSPLRGEGCLLGGCKVRFSGWNPADYAWRLTGCKLWDRQTINSIQLICQPSIHQHHIFLRGCCLFVATCLAYEIVSNNLIAIYPPKQLFRDFKRENLLTWKEPQTWFPSNLRSNF